MSLNEKQKRFIEEYLVDLNATQAAIRAGYAEATAYSQGQRLLKHVEVEAEINKRSKERSTRTKITADRILESLDDIGNSDIGTFCKSENGKLILTKELQDIEPRYRKLIKRIKTKDGHLEIELWDKMKALEMAGKHLGMFREEVQLPPPPGEKKSSILSAIEASIELAWGSGAPDDESNSSTVQ